MSDILFPMLSPTGTIVEMDLGDASHTSFPAPLTGLAHDTAGLVISTKKLGEAAPVVYSAALGTIETIPTLGTFSAPTAGKCRFREVDSVSQAGLYQFQFADSRFADTRAMVINIYGAANLIAAKTRVQMGVQEITGPHTVTVSIVSAEDHVTPIADVGVYLLNADSSAFLANRRTDVAGNAVFSINSGTYNLRLVKSGVNFDAEYPVVVGNADVPVPITGEIVSSAITDLDVQTVYHGQKTQDGVTLDPDSIIEAKLASINQTENGTVLTGRHAVAVFVSARSRFEMTLVKGKSYVVKGESAGEAYSFFNKTILVSDDDTKALTEY